MKHNLAKVLGLEQLTDERVTFNPSQEQIEQMQSEEFHQYLEDHQQATEVALEAIGSAHAFGAIIQKNNSTDKTTYELLKVAVEQLKEKTGVVTQKVALENADALNYKQESLQDIKNFIIKVMQAIKKAFFAMVDKIKAFFKGLFGKAQKVEESTDELLKLAEGLLNEISKAPRSKGSGVSEKFEPSDNLKEVFDNPESSKLKKQVALRFIIYKGDVSAQRAKSALGWAESKSSDIFDEYKTSTYYGPISENKSDWNSDYFDTQTEYLAVNFSKKRFLHLIEVKDYLKSNKAEGFSNKNELSDKLKSYFGNVATEKMSVNDRFKRFEDQISKISTEVHSVADSLKLPEIKNDGYFNTANNKLDDKEIMKGSLFIESRSFELTIQNKKLEISIGQMNQNDSEKELAPASFDDIKSKFIPYITSSKKLIEEYTRKLENKLKEMRESLKKTDSFIEQSASHFDGKQDGIKSFRDEMTESISFIQSCIAVHAKLSGYVLNVLQVFSEYLIDSINYVKKVLDKQISEHGYLQNPDEFKELGWLK